MRTSYKQLALEYQDRFCAAVADYKKENELRSFYEKENEQLKGKLKTVTEAADSTMDHMQYYEKQCKELEQENAKLQAKIDDWQSEYIELENLKNNEIAELKDKLNNLASVAEVRLANWQKYEKELKSEKEYSATLRKKIDEYTNSHTLCAKYKELQKACDETQELLDKQIEATYELDKENAELEKENASIKTLIEEQHKVGNDEFWKSVWDIKRRNVELEEEIKKWKDEWQEQVQKENDESYARTLQTMKLDRAKEIIKSLYFIIQGRIDYENNIGIADEMWRAKQFWAGK